MINPNFGWRKAGIASVATTLVLGASLAGVGAASADATFAFERIAGIDRYDTAARAADRFDPTANDVILANGVPGSYADALSANYLAGVRNDPILLTRRDVTPAFTLNQLADSGVENITIVGGTGVVSAAQATALGNAGYTVDRIAGVDRYKTNADIITAGAAANAVGVIATGLNFPDALGAGPVAFDGHALGLSRANDIDDDVVAALDAAGVTSVIVLGGPTIIGPAVLAELATAGITLQQRIFGADRSETSTDLADYAIANFGFGNDKVNVASGYGNGSGADALAGGPLTGQQNRPMLVTRDVNNVGDLDNWLAAHAGTLTGITNIIFGGTGAVSTAAENIMEAAARTAPTTNQDYGVTPTATTTATFDQGASAGAPVTVGFSGLDAARDYDVATVPCSDYDGPSVMVDGVNVLDQDGVSDTLGSISFSDQGTPADDVADDTGNTMSGNGEILTVGFVAVNATTADDVSPAADGTLSVRVGAFGGSDCLHVVAWDDNADDDLLNLGGAAAVDNDNTPTDLFALSGAITWTSGEAPNGDDMEEDVLFLNKASDFWIDEDGYTVNYGDAGDQYWYEGSEVNQAVSLSVFEQALSLGDNTSDDQAAYSRTNTNFFENEGDQYVNLASAPTATVSDLGAGTAENDVSFSWTEPVPPSADLDEYNVEIYNATTGALVTSDTTDEVNTVGGGDADTTLDFIDNGALVDGTYVARVSMDSETDAGLSDLGLYSAPFTLPKTVADPTAPTMTDAWVSTDAAPGSVLIDATGNSADVIDFAFSEDMANALGGGVATSFTLTDGVDSFIIDCALGCTLDDNETQLGVNLNTTVDDHLRVDLATATITRDTGTLAMGIPSTVSFVSAAWDDQAGNQLNLAGSADKIVDNE